MENSGKISIKRPSGWFILGNTHCIVVNGEIWLNIGPDWPFNIAVFTFLIGLLVCFIYIMAAGTPIYLQCFAVSVYVTSIVSYSLAAFKNPGIILSPWELEMEEGNSSQICKICKVATEPGSAHCDDCQVCIRKHDHHCPFTGKCIGSGNTIPFHIFLLTIFLCIFQFALWVYYKGKKSNS